MGMQRAPRLWRALWFLQRHRVACTALFAKGFGAIKLEEKKWTTQSESDENNAHLLLSPVLGERPLLDDFACIELLALYINQLVALGKATLKRVKIK